MFPTSCLAVFPAGAAEGGGCACGKNFNCVPACDYFKISLLLGVYRDILCFNLSILGYLYHWRRRFRNSGRRRQLRRRRRRCKGRREANKTWRRPWPAQVEGRLSIAEVRNQISITKVYNLHDRLIQFIVINLLIDHLGRPRIDWNSDVEPRPKPPNRSWAPAIENQGNKYVMDGSYEAAPLWELCRKDEPWLEEGGSKLGSEILEVGWNNKYTPCKITNDPLGQAEGFKGLPLSCWRFRGDNFTRPRTWHHRPGVKSA